MGAYQDIHYYNRENTTYYNYHVLSYVRWSEDEKLVVIANFNAHEKFGFDLAIPAKIIHEWNLKDKTYELVDQLYFKEKGLLQISGGIGHFRVDIAPLESFIFKLDASI